MPQAGSRALKERERASTAERELEITRVLDAPRDLVFKSRHRAARRLGGGAALRAMDA